ncbi:MAG: ribonuclease III [Desulfobacteraceae bacterium]|jgi:ribonuclease-3
MDPIDFQRSLCYQFTDIRLLEEALRHSSYVNEQLDPEMRDNERMEFLGDAVLNLVVGHLLMKSYPQMREGELSRIRANLVNETQLAGIARTLDLGSYLLLGKGEVQSNGREKNSLLANALEAVIAAVYLDGGFEVAAALLEHHFKTLIQSGETLTIGQDYKSRLQEAVQGTIKKIPQYQVVRESGPDHNKTFTIEMNVGDLQTQGTGKNKKTAEQEAARKGLELFEQQDIKDPS